MARRARSSVLPIILGIRRYVGRIRRELALELVDILRETTPIDTGHARSNWIPKLGRPYQGVAGSREAVDWGPQQRGIREIIDEPQESRRVANIGNRVRYVPKLNKGSSQQAGPHFIEAALAQAKVNVRMRLGRLKRAR